MKRKYSNNSAPLIVSNDDEDIRWAIEILGAYNIAKTNGKKEESWLWAVKTIYIRHKARCQKRRIPNLASFSSLITPVCHALQPKKKKVKSAEELINEEILAREQEFQNENALLCRDKHGDPINAD